MAISRSRELFSLCSLLMGTLFAYSASVQLNDSDWYFWFPLYSCACVVNLTNCIIIFPKLNRKVAKLALWLGILLFAKVVVEDLVYGISGFWSLDLSERVVREKTGSLLVILSMILHLHMEQSCVPNKQNQISSLVNYGMLILVLFSYMLPFVFFVVRKGEMKF
ncbi:transmembrane protein 220 [Senna tora]|uniref:Transmembrane protein 220 n=1 Tax=Senna tora TaxID=362788 RepID=A0A834WR70_9FABA|nr:transmembrane protein 220 [Senna tora]